jgi:hypothetical protein
MDCFMYFIDAVIFLYVSEVFRNYFEVVSVAPIITGLTLLLNCTHAVLLLFKVDIT